MAYVDNMTTSNNSTSSTTARSFTQLLTMMGYGPLIRILTPAYFLAGLFGNGVLIISVIARKLHERSPVFIFLAFIAMADCVSLVAVYAYDILDLIWGFVPNQTWCTAHFYLLTVAKFTSVYLLIAVYIFKLHSLRRPLDLIAKSQSRRTVIICLSITGTMVIADSYSVIRDVNSLETFMFPIYIKNIKVQFYGCAHNPKYPTHSFVLPIVTTVMYAVIPGISLTVLSVAILVVLHRCHKLHERMKNTGEQSVKSVYTSAKASASILIVMSAVHILTTLARYIDIVIATYNSMNVSVIKIEHLSVGGSIYNMLIRMYVVWKYITPLNFSLNFYLQLIASTYFRETLFPCLTAKM